MTRRRKIILWIAVSLVALIVGGRVALSIFAPDIVRRLVSSAVQERTAMAVSMGDIRVQGLAGLCIRNFRLTEAKRPGVEVFYAEEIHVSLASVPWPWADRVTIDEVRIVRPRVLAVREADGRLNFQRLTRPKDKPPGEAQPAGPAGAGKETIVRTITIEGADLRFLDQFDQAGHAAGENGAGRLMQVSDLSLTMRLADRARLLYDFDVALDDPSWGQAAFKGRAGGKPFAFSLCSTGGALTISPENLVTLPALGPQVIERIRRLSPSARLVVRKFSAERLDNLPQAEIELRDLSMTAPGEIHLEGLSVDVSTGPKKIAATVRSTKPLPLPGAGPVAGLEMAATYSAGGLVARLVRAEVLGGKVSGEVTFKDIARDPFSVQGQLDIAGIALGREGLPYRAAIDGRVTIGPGPVSDDPRGNQPRLAIGFRGEARGGHVEQAPLVMPLEVQATVNPQRLDGAVPFQVTLGTREGEVYLSGGGNYFRERGEIALAATSGAVRFSPGLLARLGNLAPQFVEQTQAQGRLVISSPGGTINLKEPAASRGSLAVTSDNLKMRIPGTDRVEQLAFRADLHSADDDPSVALVGKVTVSRPESGGSAVADLVLDRLGSRLDGKVVLARLPVTQDLLKEILGGRSPAAAAALGRVGDLSLLAGGTANVVYDCEKKKLIGLNGNAQLADLSLKALADVGGEKVALPITNGSGEIVFDQVARTARADLSFGVLGGRVSLALHDRPGDVVVQLATLDGRPLNLERLPKPVKDKLPIGLQGKLIVAAQTSAKSKDVLAEAKVDFNAQLADGVVTTAGDEGRPPRVFRTAASVSGSADLKQRTISNLKAQVTDLRDAGGGYYLPPQVTLNVALAPFAIADGPGKGAMALSGPRFGTVKSPLVYDRSAGTVAFDNIRAAVNLAAVPWRQMAAPVAERVAALAPQGEIRTVGPQKAWVRYDIAAGQATYALNVQTVGLSWMQGRSHTRAKPLDAEIKLARPEVRSGHQVRLKTSDPDYGNLAAAATLGDNDFSFEVQMRRTVLEPSLLALGGPGARKFQDEFHPAGVFTTRDLAAHLTRERKGGKWRLADLSGTITGDNISLDVLDGHLPLRSATMKIVLSKDLVVLEKLEGFLAEGKLSAKGELSLTGKKAFKGQARLPRKNAFEGDLALERLDVRHLAAVAGMAENEMVGRLTIKDFTFAGRAGDLNALTGRGHVSFGEGHLWQLPMFKVVRVGLFDGIAAFLRGKFDPTSFRSAESDFRIAGGKVSFPEATVDSDLIRMVIDGDVGFDSRLDLHVAASVRGQGSPLGRLGGLGGLLGEDFKKVDKILKRIPSGGLPILGSFYHITGTFGEPVRKSDPKRAWRSLSGAATDFLKRKDEPKTPPGGNQKNP